MTRHHNNAKNRKRDLEAHHEHVHRYDKRTIAGGVFVVNGAIQFQSSLRQEPNLHAKGSVVGVRALVAHCVAELRNVAERNSVDDDGMDAKCVLVLDMDNIDLKRTKYESRPPAPQTGDPLHYDSFLQRICNQYRERFL